MSTPRTRRRIPPTRARPRFLRAAPVPARRPRRTDRDEVRAAPAARPRTFRSAELVGRDRTEIHVEGMKSTGKCPAAAHASTCTSDAARAPPPRPPRRVAACRLRGSRAAPTRTACRRASRRATGGSRTDRNGRHPRRSQPHRHAAIESRTHECSTAVVTTWPVLPKRASATAKRRCSPTRFPTR